MDKNVEERLAKNERIKNTMKETMARHSKLQCKTITTKIQKNKLKPNQLEALRMIFIEAKWFWNFMLDWLNDNIDKWLTDFNIGNKNITHKNKDMEDIPVTLKYLKASHRDLARKRMISNIKTLNTLKERGVQSPGKLKFKSKVNIVDYKQYGVTHKILGPHKVKLQGIPGTLVVNGLQQFLNIDDENLEITTARLINKGDDYYIQWVIYCSPEEVKHNNKTIGVDLGCNPNYALSDGAKDLVLIQETERLKRLQKKLTRQVKGSKGYWKTRAMIDREYAKLTNRKNNAANKLVYNILENGTVVMQDEQLKTWHAGGHGKAVQHSILGRVKAKLKDADNVIILPRNYPTTKLCRECGQYHDELNQWDKVFKCDCGVVEDRDIHAAKNMVWLYENIVKKLGVERAEVTRAEMQALVKEALASGNQLASSWKTPEAPAL